VALLARTSNRWVARPLHAQLAKVRSQLSPNRQGPSVASGWALEIMVRGAVRARAAPYPIRDQPGVHISHRLANQWFHDTFHQSPLSLRQYTTGLEVVKSRT